MMNFNRNNYLLVFILLIIYSSCTSENGEAFIGSLAERASATVKYGTIVMLSYIGVFSYIMFSLILGISFDFKIKFSEKMITDNLENCKIVFENTKKRTIIIYIFLILPLCFWGNWVYNIWPSETIYRFYEDNKLLYIHFILACLFLSIGIFNRQIKLDLVLIDFKIAEKAKKSQPNL